MPNLIPIIPEILKDQPIQAAPIESMREVVVRSGVSVADPLVARVGPHGTALSIDLPTVVWAKLSGTTSPYSWVEQVPTSSGWIDGYRSGTSDAYEVNGFGKMDGQVVRLTKGAWDDWRFQRHGPCCPSPPPTCSPATFAVTVFGCGSNWLGGWWQGSMVEQSAPGEVPGATFTITDHDDPTKTWSVTTDSNGFASFTIPTGTTSTHCRYDLKVTASGYADSTGGPIQIQTTQAGYPFNVYLCPTQIAFTVYGCLPAPNPLGVVPNATVTLYGNAYGIGNSSNPQLGSGTTDANGQVVIDVTDWCANQPYAVIKHPHFLDVTQTLCLKGTGDGTACQGQSLNCSFDLQFGAPASGYHCCECGLPLPDTLQFSAGKYSCILSYDYSTNQGTYAGSFTANEGGIDTSWCTWWDYSTTPPTTYFGQSGVNNLCGASSSNTPISCGDGGYGKQTPIDFCVYVVFSCANGGVTLSYGGCPDSTSPHYQSAATARKKTITFDASGNETYTLSACPVLCCGDGAIGANDCYPCGGTNTCDYVPGTVSIGGTQITDGYGGTPCDPFFVQGQFVDDPYNWIYYYVSQ